MQINVETYFISIRLLDNYLLKLLNKQNQKDDAEDKSTNNVKFTENDIEINQIARTSLFIASKFNEIQVP